MPTADVSARPAVPDDAAAIAQIQLEAWTAIIGADAVAGLPAAQVEETWRMAVTTPPSRSHRVFVATDGPRVVGFAAIAEDDVVALEVAPGERRVGHGSRLLAACVDTMRMSGRERLRMWVLEDDEARTRFATSAGLGPVGRRRGFAAPDGELTENAWEAAIH